MLCVHNYITPTPLPLCLFLFMRLGGGEGVLRVPPSILQFSLTHTHNPINVIRERGFKGGVTEVVIKLVVCVPP